MSSQTHRWPGNNNINIFLKKRHTYKYKGANSLNIFLFLPVHQVFEQIGYSTNTLVWRCRCVLQRKRTAECMLPSYWASTRHCSSLYTGCGSALGRKDLSSRRPPTTCVNAYLVLCPPCGDLLAYNHTSIIQRNKKNNKKNKIVALYGTFLRGFFCQSWCSLIFFLQVIVFLQHHTVSSDITHEERYSEGARSSWL